MPRERTIVGIGEALLAEYPDRVFPSGIAVETAIAARRLRHTGIVVSRLGQDLAANELLTMLHSASLDVSPMQSDPDLPTGRLIVRTIAGQTRRSLQPRAAFDNLQWDFDLVDVAQRTDAVVYGMLAQRDGQSRAVVTRFLSECGAALRVCDLTNRHDEPIDRRRVSAATERADMIVYDAHAWRAIGYAGDPTAADDIIAAFMRHTSISLTVYADAGQPLVACSADGQCSASNWKHEARVHADVIVGMIHGVMEGRTLTDSLQLAERAMTHARSGTYDMIDARWADDAP